jgi:hypothetical protein
MPPPPRKLRSGPPPRRVKRPSNAIHIQKELLDIEDTGPKSDYTRKILAPIYEPKNRKPNVIELVNQSKAKALSARIYNSKLNESEKNFLLAAAYRHNVFNYKLIADYYAHSGIEMQALMEESALVIIDFDKAIRNGFVKYSEEIKKLYIEEYEKSK